ncbi:hypothetical protein Taro_035520 [Colocasia esculenta]|uniref:Uncharacterized protein n=1 Tax=Colocasia esculenta TaxID=4460 RepID=A0A843W415_COLES|nr:hypothetical protein [Colocasia esculenta]
MLKGEFLGRVPACLLTWGITLNGKYASHPAFHLSSIIAVPSYFSIFKDASVTCNGNEPNSGFDISSLELKYENRELTERLKRLEDDITSLTEKLEEAEKKLEQANKEQEALVDLFSEERSRRDKAEEVLRKKLKDASVTIQELLQKLSSNSSRGGC